MFLFHFILIMALMHRVRQKKCLLEYGIDMGVIIHSLNLNISPNMSYGVLECDIVMLQNYTLMYFVIKDFVIKKSIICARPCTLAIFYILKLRELKWLAQNDGLSEQEIFPTRMWSRFPNTQHCVVQLISTASFWNQQNFSAKPAPIKIQLWLEYKSWSLYFLVLRIFLVSEEIIFTRESV